ncbi:hypothetical protein QJS04_geneDACA004778 [Acorus gramineus]|uniref:DUF7952 domain-containing protein n=1 Tax=Acorus gramineus TaxID=55184 RepID=A0AAV9BTK5_ACOGR|nr:hypothetical protein QJS04_geneDACA004778 [Acorus gramineus]
MRFVKSKGVGESFLSIMGSFIGKKSTVDGLSVIRCGVERVFINRIFTEWRQQELLSRLISQVSKESQNSLLEVSYVSLQEHVIMKFPQSIFFNACSGRAFIFIPYLYSFS